MERKPDLHDYRDVAENYDRYLEVMYAHDDHLEIFREFYLDLARRYGSNGVVDVACGTGAVLLYLAERGVDIDGTDLSEEMCRVAGDKAEQLGLKLNIFPADMTVFSSGRKYSLAIIARSGFMHLPTQELQEKALLNLREQLLPGGILTLNTFDPWPPLQAEQMRTTPEDYTIRLEYVNSAGNREKIWNAITYDSYTQQMYGNWKFEEFDADGSVISERVRPLRMRQTTRWEMFLLARLCGFEVLDIYRGYNGDKEDLKDISTASKYRSNLIWILKRKD
ncbi:MAG: class I SAM-dependent methyltransferase [Clostridia bacterium]|nr:class I SAM-dependent methyltransferase [Clostridia bacterium]